jgi:hypothetical protein
VRAHLLQCLRALHVRGRRVGFRCLLRVDLILFSDAKQNSLNPINCVFIALDVCEKGV